MEILELIKGLSSTNNNYAYSCLQRLETICKDSNKVYAYFNELSKLLQSANSYQRARAFRLIATCAKWDKEGHIDKIINELLACIVDDSPICARQCICATPLLANSKPHLQEHIASALSGINPLKYKESMQSLILKDIKYAIDTIACKSAKDTR